VEKIRAGGIIQNLGLAQIGVMSVPDRPGIASAVFGVLSAQGINVQFIVQSIDLRNRTHIILLVDRDDLDATLLAIRGIKPSIQAEEIVAHGNVAMMSVFGPHFRDEPGIASAAFSALASAGINILAISTSISTISCVVDGDRAPEAVDALRGAFDVPSSAVFTAAKGLSLSSKLGNRGD
jgi:aspartate kinase